jgi:hypothetical protein
MNISSTSMETSLASLATQMSASEVQGQISIAVLKQIQRQQQQAAQSLIQMMSQTPGLDGTGRIINLAA